MKKYPVITISSLLLSAAGLHAQATEEAFTTPVGYVTHTLKAGQFNLVGLTVHNPIEVSGDFEAVSGTTLTDTDADFNTSLTDGDTYILEITSGTLAGTVQEILWASNGATTLVTSDNLGTEGLVASDTYQIRKAVTLQGVLGSPPQLRSTVAAASSDVVWVPDGGGSYKQYFYKTPFFGDAGWYDAETDAELTSEIPLVYTDAFFVQVKSSSSDIDLVISGSVKTGVTDFSVFTGFNLISSVYPVGTTLQNAGLETQLRSTVAAASSDVLWVPDGSGSYDQYFYKTPFFGDSEWVDAVTDTAVTTDVVLPSGLFIQRKGEDVNLSIDPPADYSNL